MRSTSGSVRFNVRQSAVLGAAYTEIAERVAKKFDVTVEYVKELMLPKGSIRKTTTEVMIKSRCGRLCVYMIL